MKEPLARGGDRAQCLTALCPEPNQAVSPGHSLRVALFSGARFFFEFSSTKLSVAGFSVFSSTNFSVAQFFGISKHYFFDSV